MLQQQPTSPATPAAGAQPLTDSLGRLLPLRVLNPADMLDLIEAGGNAASNPAWIRYVTAIAGVAAIDNLPVPVPVTRGQIRDLARRLGNEGMSALAARKKAREEQARAPAEDEEEAAGSDAEQESALAKN